ncbi:MAG: hypothetical protein KBT63_12515 [Porticoccaceae bacterium]|nr:hypothetical protein [Porticoccaceae bacterium]
MKYAWCLLSLIILSGCVPYPVYKTLQPSSGVMVVDTAEDPIEGAEVNLIASSYPYGYEKSRNSVKTDADGKANFQSLREWRTEAIMLHGAEIFFWNWCVSKEGYETYLSNNTDSREFDSKAYIILNRGKSNACPEQLR